MQNARNDALGCSHAGAHPITAAYDGSPALEYSGLIVHGVEKGGPPYVAQVFWCVACGSLGIQHRDGEAPRWFPRSSVPQNCDECETPTTNAPCPKCGAVLCEPCAKRNGSLADGTCFCQVQP